MQNIRRSFIDNSLWVTDTRDKIAPVTFYITDDYGCLVKSNPLSFCILERAEDYVYARYNSRYLVW